MTQVGIREMKSHLSEYIRRAKNGEQIEITEHGKAVARLEPAVEPYPKLEGIWNMVREGAADWNGGKPSGSKKKLKIKGKPLSKTVLEDRGDSIP